ncbi:hypothetical protein [Streptomyces kronopolitis]|uniref:hypothetical protein n=1 Tax=Streptomyces kronopolitis TaxID=1612435 RepID=UPI003D977D99
MSPQETATAVYSPQPLTIGPGQALSPAHGFQTASVVVVQQQAPQPSWLKAHAGQLIAGAGAGGLVIAVLLAVAVVAVAIGIGAISCALGWLVIKSLIGDQSKK